MKDWREGFERAPLALRVLVCAGLLHFLCAGVYLSWFTNGSDFALVHRAGARVLTGQGAHVYDEFLAYRPENPDTLFFMYPPPVAVLYAPLGALPFRTALTSFGLLGQAALLAAFLVWARWRRFEPSSDKGLLALGLMLLFVPLDYAFQLGQNEAVVLLLLVLALAWERPRPALAGLALAAAVWLKVFLGLALLYLLLRRRWRLLLWTGGWLAALAAVSLAFVPWEAQLRYFSRLGQELGIESFYDNQSLTGVFHRSLTFSGYTRGLTDSPALARVLVRLSSLLLLGGFCWAVRRVREEEGHALGWGLCIVTALLLSPHADTHHQALLLVPLLLLVERPRVATASLLYYGFFAAFLPVIAFRFLAQEQLLFFAAGPQTLVYSIPALVLLGFWFHCAGRLEPSKNG